ncbi:endospore germination permease [Desulfitobacterium sp.]|uniref:GerAB/ArcD/ProY family transporter n=1 Tax=Desulfitobacterium sp. TaxID=49981 RepID=UPI002B2137A9|nr:endospore germination permease [Desulfitobacterium sp.]MEA4902968.1 endospore germination permease [Desulfitobacterium sp.]
MLEGGKISARQMILLVFVSRVIYWITSLPVLLAPPANQDVWIDLWMAVPIYWIVALPFYFLAKRFPQQSFYEYTQAITGKAGPWLGILYVLFLLHITGLTLTNFSEFFTTAVMPETPSLFFVISLTLIAAYAVYHGIEVLGRLSELIAPIIMIAIIGVVLLLVNDMNLQELTPFLEKGIYPSIFTGLSPVGQTIEIIEVAIILPFLNDLRKTKKVFIYAPLLLVFFLFILTFSELTVLGDDLAKTYTYPFYNIVRLIHVGDFLERIEVIHVTIWILGMFVKTAFQYYVIVLGIGQLFHLKSYKPLILPMGIIIVASTNMLGSNVVAFREFLSFEIYDWYTMFFILFIPSLLLLTAVLRKKGEYSK